MVPGWAFPVSSGTAQQVDSVIGLQESVCQSLRTDKGALSARSYPRSVITVLAIDNRNLECAAQFMAEGVGGTL